MTHIFKRLMAGLVIAASTVGQAHASVIDFTYNVSDVSPSFYGFGKKESYDVAIKICDADMAGAHIRSLKVAMPEKTSAFADCKGWLSSELKLDAGRNVPDVAVADGVMEDNMLTVVFDKEYVIPDNGIWVGYSFDINDVDKTSCSPVACVAGASEFGLWIHTSRSRRKWMDLGAAIECSSAMVVTCITDHGPTDVAVQLAEQYYAAREKDIFLPVTLINHGDDDLTEIGYSYKVGDVSGTGTAKVDPPIKSASKRGEAQIRLSPISATGNYPFELTVDSFNGKENRDPAKNSTSCLEVLPFLPENRPLVEEYTGLKCGNCPLGYVTMAQLNDRYGDNFVALAYHVPSYEPGCMTVLQDSQMPFKVSGYPAVTVNRDSEISFPVLEQAWDRSRRVPVPANLEVTMSYDDDTHRMVIVNTKTRFTKDYQGSRYRLSIALGANGLYNDSWKQRNYFKDADMEGDYWELFVGQPSYVSGLVFNDVAVHYKAPEGIEDSLPENIIAEEEYSHEYAIDMTEVRNINGEYFINEGASLYAVAILIDTETGLPVNSNKSEEVSYSLPDGAGVADFTRDAPEVVSSVWYDVCGNSITVPVAGVNVVVEKMSDGSFRRIKVLK